MEIINVCSETENKLAEDTTSLGDEIDNLVTELSTIDVNFKNITRERVRTIGQFLNDAGGFILMQAVWYRVDRVSWNSRILDIAWDGIGNWES
jgi:hypothetical protein